MTREEAIDVIKHNYPSACFTDLCEAVEIAIQALSVQPRRGKWIRTRTLMHDGELYCDQCDQEHPEQKKIWNFCPNCGCHMEEGDAE